MKRILSIVTLAAIIGLAVRWNNSPTPAEPSGPSATGAGTQVLANTGQSPALESNNVVGMRHAIPINQCVDDQIVTVRGRLVVKSGEAPTGVQIEVTLIGRQNVSTSTVSSEEGIFRAELPMDRLGEERWGADTLEFILETKGPGFLPLAELISVPFPDNGPDGRTSTLESVIQRTYGEISGIVSVTGNGHSIGEVHVAAYYLDSLGIPLKGPHSTGKCDESGRFMLPLGESVAPFIVVATAPGLRPSTSNVLTSGGSPIMLGLTPGEAITGAVAFPIDEVAIISGSAIEAENGREWRWQNLIWMDAGFEHGQFQVTTTRGGAFSITGLAPSIYLLKLNLVKGTITFAPGTKTVMAPASSVAIGQKCATLTVLTASAENPLQGSSVKLSTRTQVPGSPVAAILRKSQSTTADGRVTAIIESGVEYQLDVELPFHSSYSEKLHPLGKGELRVVSVQLEPTTSASSIKIIFGDTTKAPSLVYVELIPKNRPAGTGRIERTRRGSSGALSIAGIPPGEYMIHLSPTRGSFDGNFALDVRRDLTLKASETYLLPITLELGGRFRIDSRHMVDNVDYLDTVLRDGGGETLLVYYRSRVLRESPSGELSPFTNREFGTLSAGRIAEAYPNLPAGAYTLQVADSTGHESLYPVEIQAGVVTDIVIP